MAPCPSMRGGVFFFEKGEEEEGGRGRGGIGRRLRKRMKMRNWKRIEELGGILL